jgi:hypothetical protein
MRRVGAVKQEDLKVVDVNEDKEEIKNGKNASLMKKLWVCATDMNNNLLRLYPS